MSEGDLVRTIPVGALGEHQVAVLVVRGDIVIVIVLEVAIGIVLVVLVGHPRITVIVRVLVRLIVIVNADGVWRAPVRWGAPPAGARASAAERDPVRRPDGRAASRLPP
jgi:hypothetical protein